MFKAALTGWISRIAIVSILAFGARATAQTSCVTLSWAASTDTNVVGYNVYYGVESRVYTNSIDEGNVTTATICGLDIGTTYYFAVTAYDSFGLESDYSNEISYTIPATNGAATVALTQPANGAASIAAVFFVSRESQCVGAVSVDPTGGGMRKVITTEPRRI